MAKKDKPGDKQTVIHRDKHGASRLTVHDMSTTDLTPREILQRIELVRQILGPKLDSLKQSRLFQALQVTQEIAFPNILSLLDLITSTKVGQSGDLAQKIEEIITTNIFFPLEKWLETLSAMEAVSQIPDKSILVIDDLMMLNTAISEISQLEPSYQPYVNKLQQQIASLKVTYQQLETELHNFVQRLRNLLAADYPNLSTDSEAFVDEALFNLESAKIFLQNPASLKTDLQQANKYRRVLEQFVELAKSLTTTFELAVLQKEQYDHIWAETSNEYDYYHEFYKDCQNRINQALASLKKKNIEPAEVASQARNIHMAEEIIKNLLGLNNWLNSRLESHLPNEQFNLPNQRLIKEISETACELESVIMALSASNPPCEKVEKPQVPVKKAEPETNHQNTTPVDLSAITTNQSFCQEPIQDLIFAAFALFKKRYTRGRKGKGARKISKILVLLGVIKPNQAINIIQLITQNLVKEEVFKVHTYPRKDKSPQKLYELVDEKSYQRGLQVLARYPKLEDLILKAQEELQERWRERNEE